MAKADTERFSTWISSDVMRAARIYAAYHGVTQRQLIEDALRAFMESNPIDLNIIDPSLLRFSGPGFESVIRLPDSAETTDSAEPAEAPAE